MVLAYPAKNLHSGPLFFAVSSNGGTPKVKVSEVMSPDSTPQGRQSRRRGGANPGTTGPAPILSVSGAVPSRRQVRASADSNTSGRVYEKATANRGQSRFRR